MFELSVALKYLIPRWRQLSVSIISLISIAVIALVVWLIVVFFSVTHGLERSWVQKLIALTAPVRITPTQYYYQSYYYQIDSICSDSNYCHKSIGQKLASSASDPYNADFDEEIPASWPLPDVNHQGELKDPVKIAFAAINKIHNIPGVEAKEFEMTVANLRIDLQKPPSRSDQNDQFISQGTYLGAYDPDNPYLPKAVFAYFQEKLPQYLPSDNLMGEAILLPKSYRDAGVYLQDQGYLTYQVPTASAMQEQRIPVFVAGFYDPGILPLGGKIALINPSIVSIIRSSYSEDQNPLSNGISVRMTDLSDATAVKAKIVNAFQSEGIDRYWNVETYREFEYTKDILQQLRSERNLFSIISTVIIIVACSNIISMLIILVNDKKMEIGILRSMGASSKSIAWIFGTCGVVMGLIGSAVGILLALFTLKNLQALIDFISHLQGFDAFNPAFYGETLPNEVSFQALSFVLGATVIISFIAGVVPAVKACLLRPSAILRSE